MAIVTCQTVVKQNYHFVISRISVFRLQLGKPIPRDHYRTASLLISTNTMDDHSEYSQNKGNYRVIAKHITQCTNTIISI